MVFVYFIRNGEAAPIIYGVYNMCINIRQWTG